MVHSPDEGVRFRIACPPDLGFVYQQRRSAPLPMNAVGGGGAHDAVQIAVHIAGQPEPHTVAIGSRGRIGHVIPALVAYDGRVAVVPPVVGFVLGRDDGRP